ncbi:hypothetical protein [Chroococcidiopsis sp. CCMEE 29]|uniref:hypothetical protein n=1 Tax=Chroococcidiopsis sp. CCMEE 29 TaxID=155894 RepID=UPI002021031C|nr:hypothetical protein [Chroococcidiopsis sp. CCMEE 29]
MINSYAALASSLLQGQHFEIVGVTGNTQYFDQMSAGGSMSSFEVRIRIDHIARHRVNPEEVEETCFGVLWFNRQN